MALKALLIPRNRNLLDSSELREYRTDCMFLQFAINILQNNLFLSRTIVRKEIVVENIIVTIVEVICWDIF